MGKVDPTNAATKAQIAQAFDKAIEDANNPNPFEKIKRERKEKAKKVSKTFGF